MIYWIVNLFFIAYYIVYHKIFFSKKQKKSNGIEILIVFQQVFGDSIIFSDSLQHYTKLYPPEKGYHITLLCRPSIEAFMRDVLPLPEGIDIVSIDFKRLIRDFRYFRQTVQAYGDKADLLIVPGTSFSAELFSAASAAPRRVGLLPSIPRVKPKLLVWLQKMAYTEAVRPEKELMMLQRQRTLLEHLGLSGFQSRLPRLLPQPRMLEDVRYCIICPGSSMREKCWPVERFAEIGDWLMESKGWKVLLCGGADETVYGEAFLTHIKHKENVINAIGKTTFAQWSSFVQHAELVVGNDSATMHLAAAAQKPAVCIAGIYDKNMFFPYHVDLLETGEQLPETVLVDMPCMYCRTKSYFYGAGNAQCKQRIKNGGCALCIEKISTEMVRNAIGMLPVLSRAKEKEFENE